MEIKQIKKIGKNQHQELVLWKDKQDWQISGQAHQEGKRERTQITKIRNVKGDIATNATEIQWCLRDYSNNYNKMDYLEAIGKFLEMCNLPSLNQDETENMKRPITGSDIESVIK